MTESERCTDPAITVSLSDPFRASFGSTSRARDEAFGVPIGTQGGVVEVHLLCPIQLAPAAMSGVVRRTAPDLCDERFTPMVFLARSSTRTTPVSRPAVAISVL
jgi:hypothetical protein